MFVCLISCIVLPSPTQIFPDTFVGLSRRFNDVTVLRRAAAIVSIGAIGAINLTDMIICSTSSANHLTPPGAANATNASTFAFESTVCTSYPSYFSNFTILILIATSVVVQLTHMCKFGLMLAIAGTYFTYYFSIL